MAVEYAVPTETSTLAAKKLHLQLPLWWCCQSYVSLFISFCKLTLKCDSQKFHGTWYFPWHILHHQSAPTQQIENGGNLHNFFFLQQQCTSQIGSILVITIFFSFYFCSQPLILHVTTKKELKTLKIIRSDQTFRSERHEDRPGRRLLDPACLRAAGGLLRRSEQGLPTCWARRPRQEPSVDAPDMESMVALGEDPDMLSSLKVGEADRAHWVGSIELQPSRVD